MRWNSRFPIFTISSLVAIAMGSVRARTPESAPAPIEPTASIAFSFMKGDTRNGTKIQIRIVGDSLQYRETVYRPSESPVETRKSALMNSYRRKALKSVMGDLPRYPAFGTCFGKGMRYYMVETEGHKFYRSLPERAGKCYTEEPGIWSLFEDIDDLMRPPLDPDYQEYSAS